MNQQKNQLATQSHVWVIDDDTSIRFVLEKAMQRAGYEVTLFSHTKEALTALDSADAESAPRVLLCDIRMPGGSGLELLEQVQEKHPSLPVIIMTAYSDMSNAINALSKGAFEYVTKPFDIQELVALVGRAIDNSAMSSQSVTQIKTTGIAHAANNPLLGNSPAMQNVYRMLGKLSTTTATVLIRGETGTGKELVARALHQHSPNKNGPFIAINTAAIPKDLLESELFGHEKGAFTGANTTRIGRFEQASGGTLFLDEIGDMPFDLQTRLLRVLSEGAFYRVGGMKSIPVQARIVAATHQNLEQKVQANSFRQDLLHRLNVIEIKLPALRQRTEDMPLLLQHFMQLAAKQIGADAKTVDANAVAALQSHAFPGNVRELENLCHSLMVVVSGKTVTKKDLPAHILQSSVHKNSGEQQGKTKDNNWQSLQSLIYETALSKIQNGDKNVWQDITQEVEKQLIQAALQHSGNKKVQAASLLGIGRNTLTRKLQEFF